MQEIQDDDPEVWAEVEVHVIALHEGIIESLESLSSDWARRKRLVAWLLKYKKILTSRTRHQPSVCTTKALSPTDLTMSLLEYVQQEIIRLYQQQVFNKETDHLKDDNTGDRKSLRRRSGIYNLDPYIDEKDLLRVGEDSSLHLNDIRPVLLGKDGNIPRLIVEWCHKKVVHEACHK